VVASVGLNCSMAVNRRKSSFITSMIILIFFIVAVKITNHTFVEQSVQASSSDRNWI